MNGVPIHPMIVHFPMVLAILLPIAALGALWAIRRGTRPLRAWLFPVGLAGGLALSAFVAVRTGETEEEKVEDVVSENVLHTHEEAGERFLVLSAVLFVVALGGLAGGVIGNAARLVGTAGTLVLVVAGVQVGKAGGELVYVHGAASAYSADAPTAGNTAREEHR